MKQFDDELEPRRSGKKQDKRFALYGIVAVAVLLAVVIIFSLVGLLQKSETTGETSVPNTQATEMLTDSTESAMETNDPQNDTSGSMSGDTVTAKIEVNLRSLPSITNPDATVVAVLHNGEVVTRTGINNEFGWSRVDYNGQTLYCISSYLTGAQ